MGECPQVTYAAALGELRVIRDRLVAGHTDPEDVERLVERAAAAALAARAALRRAGDAVEILGAAAVGPLDGAVGGG